jgi:hypothetical protein
MRSIKIMGLCLAAVFVMSAVAATAAQAAEGPLWIVGSSAASLKTGETRAIKATGVNGPFTLTSALVNVVCKKLEGTGILLGGNPGTDYGRIVFKECSLEGHAACKVTGIAPLKAAALGEIVVDVYSKLVYPKGKAEGESALEAFAPVGETANPNLFVELETESSVTNCATFSKIKIPVEAIGTELVVEGVTRKCGQLAEVGDIVGGAFSLTKPGATEKIGLLRLPASSFPEEAEALEGGAFKTIGCKIEVRPHGAAHEIATTEIEITAPTAGEVFGWDK